MRLIIVSFLMVLVVISCQRNKKENSIARKEIERSKKNIDQELNSYCFYELDDKYSIEEDSLIINNWLIEKSRILLENDSIKNIFSQNGGGPNGSQWNPSTDFYVAIFIPSTESTEVPELFINGKLYKKQVYEYSPNLIWYVINQDFWKEKVKQIDSIDIEKIYSPEFLNGIENGEFNPIANLNYGEILKFEISQKEEMLTEFFHATYGE